MKKLWDEKNGELLFYNIYCLRKELEHIDSEIKSYTYDMVVKKTKLKNKATKKWLSKIENISSGTPYGVAVFNLDYEETYNSNFYRAGYGCGGIFNNYILSVNEWKGKKTLQLKNNCKNNINDNLKDVLRDCYDNMIIIDFGFDYVLVIENIPMRAYFSITDETKHNNNYPVKEYYYEDDYVNKYLYKYKYRDEFKDLFKIKPSR